MVTLIIGGSGSGKSEYAEGLVIALGNRRRIYIATMKPWDEECRMRIKRHRHMRAQKLFLTVERYGDLEGLNLREYGNDKEKSAVLLECMSNLVSNEMYGTGEEGQEFPLDSDLVENRIIQGFLHLKEQTEDLIIVTNEVFSDGEAYSEETNRYRQTLAAINQRIASYADQVIEVVAGIPCIVKKP
jgi:adenosylcobinamide kinase/adenosylcobinamide-phosphate guanylyltransferase